MITIIQEIRHHGWNFSIITKEWPEADGAAKAIRWLRDWIEEQPQAATRLLHCGIEARQTWAGWTSFSSSNWTSLKPPPNRPARLAYPLFMTKRHRADL